VGVVGFYEFGPWRRHFMYLDPAVVDLSNSPVALVPHG
jgi:hypothetical protein